MQRRHCRAIKLHVGIISCISILLLSAHARSQTQTMKDYVYMGQQVIALETQQVTCSYQISPTAANIGSGSGSSSVTVTAPAGCGWTAVSNNTSWLTVTSGSNGSGNGTVVYAVTQNTGPARNGTITIGGQTFTVSQDSGCSFSISPTYAYIGVGGGSGTFNVYATAGCSWTASNGGNSWITITPPGAGNGNGTVGYTVGGNRGGDRYGFPIIAGQSLFVYQFSYPQPTSMTFSPNSGFAGNDSFTVTVGNGANMSIDVWATFYPLAGSSSSYQTTLGQMNAGGQMFRQLVQSDTPGTSVFIAIKNTMRDDWVYLSPQPTFLERPPKPTSATDSPNPLQLPAWQTFTMGNEQSQAVYALINNPTPPGGGYEYPLALNAWGQYPSYADCSTYPGTWVIVRVRNQLDSIDDSAWAYFYTNEVVYACR